MIDGRGPDYNLSSQRGEGYGGGGGGSQNDAVDGDQDGFPGIIVFDFIQLTGDEN